MAPAGLWFNSQYLREALVNLIADDVCRQEDYYGNTITDNMFCAGQPDWSRDACQVFTIGPDRIWIHGRLVGLLSMALCLTGRLWWASGVWHQQQILPLWGDQLGRWLRPRVTTRRLHQSDQLQAMDRGEDRASVHQGLNVTIRNYFFYSLIITVGQKDTNVLFFLTPPTKCLKSRKFILVNSTVNLLSQYWNLISYSEKCFKTKI